MFAFMPTFDTLAAIGPIFADAVSATTAVTVVGWPVPAETPIEMKIESRLITPRIV